ncbi:gamma-glutamyltransferase [Singulisphaera sp. PoT]|uniref:gamma-glutamyltransferase n=1 Tax=Singulisphaera sp. PoT TaxID=3411797 RepID=UPI003BF4C6F9
MRGAVTLSCGLLGGFLAFSPAFSPAQSFEKHVAVSQEVNASMAGRDAMRQGGNAIDAAVATAFALAVTHPAAGNIGGGGFIVAYITESREIVTVDFREKAPAASEPRMYLDAKGRLLPHHRAGARAAGVPGTVRGLGLAHAKYGRLPWKQLVTPAAELARDGFTITETLAHSLNDQLFSKRKLEAGGRDDLGSNPDRLSDFPESMAAYAKPDHTRWKAGDRLIQPDLAATLDRIAVEGPDEFYKGKTAKILADYSKQHGGLITLDDLAAYQAELRAPIHSTYRGYDIYGMGPVASGGIVLAQMLNILETFDLKSDGHQSARTLHRVTEAMRRGFYTRATEVADPAYVTVPVEKLISKEYARELASTISDRATPSEQLASFRIVPAEGNDTTHLSTMDGSGNAVALTYTLEEGYGSKAVVAGAGFLLNNEMGDFNLIPGRTDVTGRIGTTPNLIAPNKRMLSSQTPTLVLKEGKVRVVTGSPGGRTIPNTVLWVVLNLLEFELSPREAVDGARTHHAWFPDVLTLEGSSWPEQVRQELSALGHRVRSVAIQGDAHTIVVDPANGRRIGVPDHRRVTSAAAGD